MIFEKINKEIWVSMTCDDDINFRDGSSISEACNILSKYDNITTIGLNCFSPLYVKEAFEMLSEMVYDGRNSRDIPWREQNIKTI